MARTQLGDYTAAEEDFRSAASSANPEDQLDLAISEAG